MDGMLQRVGFAIKGYMKQRGHELRRPEADYLRNDIYELRAG
jgi:hypothetical protein